MDFAVSSSPAGPRPRTDSPSTRALRFFERLREQQPATLLVALRPPPVDSGTRAAVLAALPEAGEFKPDSAEAEKLAVMEEVLVYHDRRGVFETKIIDLPGLHRPARPHRAPHLATCHAAALRRRVARAGRPRDGSRLFWTDYQRARVAVDHAALQELELKCDGIALLTMVALGLDSAHLRVAARKITRFNEGIGAVANADEYPDLGIGIASPATSRCSWATSAARDDAPGRARCAEAVATSSGSKAGLFVGPGAPSIASIASIGSTPQPSLDDAPHRDPLATCRRIPQPRAQYVSPPRFSCGSGGSCGSRTFAKSFVFNNQQ